MFSIVFFFWYNGQSQTSWHGVIYLMNILLSVWYLQGTLYSLRYLEAKKVFFLLIICNISLVVHFVLTEDECPMCKH